MSDIANTIATGTAIAGAVQPELAPILEPAAAIAKGVGWVADLARRCVCGSSRRLPRSKRIRDMQYTDHEDYTVGS